MLVRQINCTDSLIPQLKASIRQVEERKERDAWAGMNEPMRVMPGTLIGLTGYKQVGKDTVANILVSRYGFVKTGFASPIREYVAKLFGWSLEELEERKEEPIEDLGGVTARHAMQTLGTEWGRTHIDKDFWVKSWTKRHTRDLAQAPVVVTDVRFPNEAETIIRLGGYVVRVERATDSQDAHISEQPLHVGYIYDVIENDDLNGLEQKIDTMLEQLRWGVVRGSNHEAVMRAVAGED